MHVTLSKIAQLQVTIIIHIFLPTITNDLRQLITENSGWKASETWKEYIKEGIGKIL